MNSASVLSSCLSKLPPSVVTLGPSDRTRLQQSVLRTSSMVSTLVDLKAQAQHLLQLLGSASVEGGPSKGENVSADPNTNEDIAAVEGEQDATTKGECAQSKPSEAYQRQMLPGRFLPLLEDFRRKKNKRIIYKNSERDPSEIQLVNMLRELQQEAEEKEKEKEDETRKGKLLSSGAKDLAAEEMRRKGKKKATKRKKPSAVLNDNIPRKARTSKSRKPSSKYLSSSKVQELEDAEKKAAKKAKFMEAMKVRRLPNEIISIAPQLDKDGRLTGVLLKREGDKAPKRIANIKSTSLGPTEWVEVYILIKDSEAKEVEELKRLCVNYLQNIKKGEIANKIEDSILPNFFSL